MGGSIRRCKTRQTDRMMRWDLFKRGFELDWKRLANRYQD